MRAQVAGSLACTWDTHLEFQSPAFSPVPSSRHLGKVKSPLPSPPFKWKLKKKNSKAMNSIRPGSCSDDLVTDSRAWISKYHHPGHWLGLQYMNLGAHDIQSTQPLFLPPSCWLFLWVRSALLASKGPPRVQMAFLLQMFLKERCCIAQGPNLRWCKGEAERSELHWMDHVQCLQCLQ